MVMHLILEDNILVYLMVRYTMYLLVLYYMVMPSNMIYRRVISQYQRNIRPMQREIS